MSEIQRLELFRDRQQRDWVQSLNSAAPAVMPDVVKGNTLELALRDFSRNPVSPAATIYIETPWNPTAIRASVGLIDAGPEYGSFKLTVDGATTDTLDWYAPDADAATIAAWKTSVLTALRALVGSDAVIATDPPDCPPHHFYFSWTDSADERVIEITDARLIPAVEALSEFTQLAPAAEQRLAFTQLPFTLTSAFDFPTPAAITVTQEAEGGAGGNEVQILAIPSSATGAFTLTHGGMRTRPLAIAGLTAAAIATALNEIMPDGTSNPSFRVAARARNKWEITFIGPLALAAQDELTVTATPADATVITGSLLMNSVRFDRALNGQPSVKVKLEVTISDAGGEQTIIRELNLLAPMTRDSTESAIEEAGAVVVRTETVYVDDGLGESFVEAAPGATFVPSAAGAALTITHGLATWRPFVTLTLHEVDHDIFALDPDDLAAALVGSRMLDDSEFEVVATSANVIEITLPWALVNDATDPLDYRLLQADIRSPESQLIVFPHKHDWDACLESLPSGQTLRDKLAATDAAIGLLSGTLSLAASRIAGRLTAEQLDISSLATALRTNAAFLTTLRDLVKDPALIENIAERLAVSAKFLETLIALATSADFLTAFVPALLDSEAFDTALAARVLLVLQGGSALPDGTILVTVPDFRVTLPPPYTLGTVEGEPVIGYGELPAARTGLSAGADLTGELSPTIVATVHTVGSSGATSQDFGARRGADFAEDATIVNPFGWWYEVTNFGSGTDWWPVETEQTLFDLAISAGDFFPESQFLIAAPVQIGLAGGQEATAILVLESGVETFEATTQLASLTWTALASWTLALNSATAFRKIAYTCTRGVNTAGTWTRATTTATVTATAHGLTTGDIVAVLITSSAAAIVLGSKTITVTGADTFTFTCLDAGSASGTITFAEFIATVKTAVTAESVTPPAGPAFRLRLRFTKFDVANPAAGAIPTGALSLVCAGVRASFAPL